MKHPKASILVVEDDPAIRNGLLDVLVFNGYQVAGVEDGGDALSLALANPYDLILLDVMLPTLDGFSICRQVRRQKPRQGIVMLTAKGSEDDVITGFKAGADDYIAKPFSLRELMVRVEAVLRRTGKPVGDETVCIHGIRFQGRTLKAVYDTLEVDLTRREMDLIAYLYAHRERIVSKKELLRDVWQYVDTTIETRTVDIHLLKLRKKIATLIGERVIIRTVRGEGYQLEPEP